MADSPTEEKVMTAMGMRRVGMHPRNGYPVEWANPHPNSILGRAGMASAEVKRIRQEHHRWVADQLVYERGLRHGTLGH